MAPFDIKEIEKKKSIGLEDILWKSESKLKLWHEPHFDDKKVFQEIAFFVPEKLLVNINSESIGELPSQLTEIYSSIERSKYILDLEDNWDDEGSPSYQAETLKIAARFLINLSLSALGVLNKVIPAPEIYHGPDGSIDILWKRETFRLLINIPENGEIPATFYGDDYKARNVLEGKFEPQKENYGLLMSLLSE